MPRIGNDRIQLDNVDKLAVSVYGDYGAPGNTVLAFKPGTADQQLSMVGIGAIAHPFTYNNAYWDRVRNNAEQTILASAARTLETDSADLTNYNGRAQLLIVNVTVDPATADITPTIQVKDPISGAYVTVWTAAVAISAVGTFTYLFQPGGAAGSYTEAVNLRIPRIWRVKVTVDDADSITYSIAGIDLV